MRFHVGEACSVVGSLYNGRLVHNSRLPGKMFSLVTGIRKRKHKHLCTYSRLKKYAPFHHDQLLTVSEKPVKVEFTGEKKGGKG